MDEMTIDITSEIDAKILDNNSRFFNGVIYVAKNNDIIYEKSSGQYGLPNVSHQFLIGSISKQMTAVLLLKLVDQQLVNINEPIINYLPEMQDDWAKLVTVKQLLNHTSGIKNIGEPLEFQAGSQFKYSPIISFYLASRIAENITGKNYTSLMNEIFTLAEMKNSGVLMSNVFLENKKKFPFLVQGYKEDTTGNIQVQNKVSEEGEAYNSSWNPGGGIISTLQDLLGWNVRLHQGKLISEQSYKLMTTASAKREHPRYGTIDYGLGIQLVKDIKSNSLEFSHSGYLDGFTSTMIYYPETKMSLILLENISWNITNVRRAFLFHDEIRNIVRKHQ